MKADEIRALQVGSIVRHIFNTNKSLFTKCKGVVMAIEKSPFRCHIDFYYDDHFEREIYTLGQLIEMVEIDEYYI